jgi:hypothetical protein
MWGQLQFGKWFEKTATYLPIFDRAGRIHAAVVHVDQNRLRAATKSVCRRFSALLV